MIFLLASLGYWAAVIADVMTSEAAESGATRERAWVFRGRDGHHSIARHIVWSFVFYDIALAAYWVEARSWAFTVIWVAVLAWFGVWALVGALGNVRFARAHGGTNE